MVFEKVQKILAEQLEIRKDSITLESRLNEDLGIDSLDAVDLVMSLEDEFELEVSDETIETFNTVSDIVEYIESVV